MSRFGGDGMGADSRGYYNTLGLSPGASVEVVGAVYRQLAKECHPDRPSCKDGGERFRAITTAYEALSDGAFKAAYDRDDDDGAPKQTSHHCAETVQTEPVLCQVCGKVTAQPRRLAFWRVTSFLVFSQKTPVHRIYCSDCASREQWKSTLWTSLLGWWGIPWGPPWSVMHGVTNATGGTREIEVDERLMWQNALAFATRAQGPLAVGLSNILRKSDNPEIAQNSAAIIQFFVVRGIDPATTLTDVWKRSFLRTVALLSIAFAVPASALAYAFIPFSLSFSKEQTSGSSAASTEDAWNDLMGASGNSALQNDSAVATTPEVSPAPVQTCDAPPSNGEVLVDHREGASSGHQIEIDNGSSGDAIIKVRDAITDKSLASFFVTRGQSASLKSIPDGEYKVQYAIGDKLAADCRTFIDDGSASASEFPGSDRLETRYEEVLDGTRISRSRLSYTLYSVPYGNVQPSTIDMDQFNKP